MRPSDAPERGAFGLAMGIASALLLLVVLGAVAYIPTNDGPQMVFAAHAENHYGDPGTVYSEQLLPNLPFTHLGFFFLTPLESVLPWRTALLVSQAAGALAMAWAFAALVAAVEPKRRALGLLGFAFAMTWSFYMGFFAYEVAVAIGMATLAYVLRNRAWSGKVAAILSLLLLLQAVAHVFAAVVTGILVAIVLVVRAAPRDRGIALGRAVLVGLPAMGILGAALAQRGEMAAIPLAAGFQWIAAGDLVQQVPAMLLPGPHVRAWLASALVVGALVGAFVRWRTSSAEERACTIGATLLLVCALVLPRDVPGWQFLSPRLLAFLPPLAIALVPVERLGSARVTTVATLAIALVSLAVTASLHRRLYAGCADDLAALDAPIQRTRLSLPLVFDGHCGVAADPDASEVPYLYPALHLGALYAVAHGGSNPYVFNGASAAYAFRARVPSTLGVPIPDVARYWPALASDDFATRPDFRRAVVFDLAAYGAAYESVLVFGARPDDETALTDLGYVPEWQKGGLFIAHFVGCEASIVVPSETARRPARLSWGTGARSWFEADLTGGPTPPAGDAVLPLKNVPCGDFWARLAPLVSSARDAKPFCAGTDGHGRWNVRLVRGSPATLTCAPPP